MSRDSHWVISTGPLQGQQSKQEAGSHATMVHTIAYHVLGWRCEFVAVHLCQHGCGDWCAEIISEDGKALDGQQLLKMHWPPPKVASGPHLIPAQQHGRILCQ